MISSRAIAAACGSVLLLMTSALALPFPNKVISWGESSPEWNRTLHLGALRLGCSDAPSSCADSAQKAAKSQGVDKVFLAILLKVDTTPGYVREYSQLSLSH